MKLGELPEPVMRSASQSMFQHLGLALRNAREILGVSQTELARRAAVGKSQLSKYEAGKELPRLEILERLLAALETTPLAFFYAMHCVEHRQATWTGVATAMLLDAPSTSLLSPAESQAFRELFGDLVRLLEATIEGRFQRKEPCS